MRIEKPNIPGPAKNKVNQRFRNLQQDVDELGRKLTSLASDRRALFGNRYSDNPTADDQLEQRQQLLSGTDRLERSSGRLRDSHRIALETEDIGRNTLADLATQRETIERTRQNLLESESYTDRSIKTLRGMARRYCLPVNPTSGCLSRTVLLIQSRSQDGYESGDYDCNHHCSCSSYHRGYCQQVQVIRCRFNVGLYDLFSKTAFRKTQKEELGSDSSMTYFDQHHHRHFSCGL